MSSGLVYLRGRVRVNNAHLNMNFERLEQVLDYQRLNRLEQRLRLLLVLNAIYQRRLLQFQADLRAFRRRV